MFSACRTFRFAGRWMFYWQDEYLLTEIINDFVDLKRYVENTIFFHFSSHTLEVPKRSYFYNPKILNIGFHVEHDVVASIVSRSCVLVAELASPEKDFSAAAESACEVSYYSSGGFPVQIQCWTRSLLIIVSFANSTCTNISTLLCLQCLEVYRFIGTVRYWLSTPCWIFALPRSDKNNPLVTIWIKNLWFQPVHLCCTQLRNLMQIYCLYRPLYWDNCYLKCNYENLRKNWRCRATPGWFEAQEREMQ